MTRHIIAACGALALCGLTASAQAPQPGAQSTPASQSAMSGDTVTISGCINVWDERLGMARADVASPQAEGAGPRQFILASKDGSDAGTYILQSSSATNLRAHVNHMVEVTGVVSNRSASGASAADDGDALPLNTLTVTSVKMVSASCR